MPIQRQTPPRSPNSNRTSESPTSRHLNLSFFSPPNKLPKSPFKDVEELKRFVQSEDSPFLESRKSPSKISDLSKEIKIQYIFSS